MWLSNPSFARIAAFIAGYDAHTDGTFLIGFREWLIVELDDGNNLGWEGLVVMLANEAALEEPTDAATATLFDLLERFLEERKGRLGVYKIYRRYDEWLRGQSWYTEAGPSEQAPPD
ncbi:MAG: hypothetical protein IPL61_30850 [Myxococcales bacterium]|nr:hypothetical protein [Myxococcales bacterium]